MDADVIQIEDNAHTGCYIFKPAARDEHEIDDRPKKKRKTNNSQSQDDEADHGFSWPALLRGREPEKAIALRQQQFQSQWDKQQTRIAAILNEVDETYVNEVLQYVRQPHEHSQSMVRTGLLVSTAAGNAQRELLQGWKSKRSVEQDQREVLLEISPGHAPNLQTVLKNLIRMAICQDDSMEEYIAFLAEQKAMVPMNFDLELLHKYVRKKNLQRVMLVISEVETFDTGILSELVSMFSSWSDRIPFVLLIGISTTVELFESRLSRSTVSLLDARVFEPYQSGKRKDPLSAVYEVVQDSEDTEVFLGPAVVSVLAELAEDQSTTAEALTAAIKYVFMSHFFANPLSILCSGSLSSSDDNAALCRAIRNTASFKRYCEALVQGDAEQRQRAHDLLASDETLVKEALDTIRHGQRRLRSSLVAIRTLVKISQYLVTPSSTSNSSRPQPTSSLEIQAQLLAALPDLTETEVFDNVDLATKQMDLSQFQTFLHMVETGAEDLKLFEQDQTTGTDIQETDATHRVHTLAEIIDAVNDNSTNTTTTTTSSRKHQTLQNEDHNNLESLTEAFLRLLTRYIHHRTFDVPVSPDTSNTTTRNTTTNTNRNPFHDFLSEAYTYNLKSPLSSILRPRARHSLERALTRPADYLGCECCSDGPLTSSTTNRATLPPTSLLLAMLNEAGHIINVRDLWDTFRDTIAPALVADAKADANADGDVAGARNQGRGRRTTTTKGLEDENDDDDDDDNGDGVGGATGDDGGAGEEGEEDIDAAAAALSTEPEIGTDTERQALALFYRALADLRYMGFVRPSKRKPGVDCIAKTVWMGL
ncbi:hypothetical protein KCU88_g5810, partial [Aureobasidium melanogenum]